MYDLEAIYAERLDTDMLQAAYDAEGDRHARRMEQVRALLEAGRRDEAQDVCPHSGGYGLNGLAAAREGDPRYGQEGYRCWECGAVVDDICGVILHRD
ncbi:MAG: hypothetical protein KatS3mg015_2479 [Fimbriimonadales bacterium]|nr:MAG: hypothetical protein KatS3mg015_2479 [Fimbriimonadales bacterium]